MSGAPTELVERLYRRLLQAVRERDGGVTGPWTVADLYQHLIPYRGVRGDLGVLELAQYEHALLRLLAGEGGFLRLLDEEAQREVAAELRATNPILGIYRDYAAAGVELTAEPEPNGRGSVPGADEPPPLASGGEGDRAREVRDVAELVSEAVEEDEDAWDLVAPPLPEMPYPPPRPAPADATRVAPVAPVPDRPVSPPPPPAPPPAPPAAYGVGTPAAPPPPPASSPPAPPAVYGAAAPPAPPPSPPGTTAAATGSASVAPVPTASEQSAAGDAARGTAARCVTCAQPLPDVAGLRFCPNCGADQVEVPCARCAAPIRGSWNFCIRCGARRPIPSASA